MKLIKRIALLKVYFGRSAQYITITNFGILIITNLKLWNINIKYYAPIMIIGLIGMLLIGWLDTKLKLFKEEQNHIANQNPILIEILENTKRK